MQTPTTDKRHALLSRHLGAPQGAHPHFIAGAIKHPGALHQDLGIPQGQPIPQATLQHAAAQPGVVGRRARFAELLKGFHR